MESISSPCFEIIIELIEGRVVKLLPYGKKGNRRIPPEEFPQYIYGDVTEAQRINGSAKIKMAHN